MIILGVERNLLTSTTGVKDVVYGSDGKAGSTYDNDGIIDGGDF